MASEHSAIEWTDATWNPTTGCDEVSAGCDHCYARELTRRFGWNGGNFNQVVLHPERLSTPLRWKEPRRIFVNSMSDLFHADVPDTFIAEVFDVMRRSPQHSYQILTKRPARMKRWRDWPENVWAGTSIEDMRVIARAEHLKQTPASTRFLSCEPLLGPLCLELTGIHWVIAGGESGPGYRLVDLAWMRAIRDQCIAANVAFFFKQWGGRRPTSGGRMLDGRTWDEYPQLVEA